MLRCLLNAQTFLYATFDASPVANPTQPTDLDFPPCFFSAEAWRWKLGTTFLADRQRTTPFGKRQNVTALVWL